MVIIMVIRLELLLWFFVFRVFKLWPRFEMLISGRFIFIFGPKIPNEPEPDVWQSHTFVSFWSQIWMFHSPLMSLIIPRYRMYTKLVVLPFLGLICNSWSTLNFNPLYCASEEDLFKDHIPEAISIIGKSFKSGVAGAIWNANFGSRLNTWYPGGN